MKKLKIIISLSVILAVLLSILLIYIHYRIEATLGFHYAIHKSDGKLKNFRDGIWIKKYPGNNACFKFETPKGVTIITDPYPMAETVEADFVTESHQHFDHTYCSKVTGRYQLITTPGVFSGKGIKICGISGKHDKGDVGVTNIIYVFDINGIRIAHFASQGEIPDGEMIEKLRNIDILLIQGFLTANMTGSKMSAQECCQVIEKIHPKIVIPEHGTKYIGNDFANHFHQKAVYIQNGEIVVTKKDLKNRMLRVVVLDREASRN